MPSKLLREFIKRILAEDVKDDKHGHPLKLRVFDFDDTLVRTDASTTVTHSDGTSSRLSPAEYALYEPLPGDRFDYREFNMLINPRVIKLTMQIFQNVYNKWGPKGLVILTARGGGRDIIQKFLSDLGTPGVEVVTLGAGSPEAKAKWMRQRIKKTHPQVVEFFDDSNKNVDAVASLQDEFDPSKTKISARHVVKHAMGVTTRSWPPRRERRSTDPV